MQIRYFSIIDEAHYMLSFDNRPLRNLFGVSDQELHDIRSAIAGLQKGELIIKGQMAYAFGMGSKYKKISATHPI